MVLVGLVLLSGTSTALQAAGRVQATDQVVSHSEPLSENTAEIYRSLADADTTAAGSFLLAANAPQAVHDRYQNDLSTAAKLLTTAAARLDTGSATGSDAQRWVTELNQQLPQYAGLVEDARTYDRQGLPLGGAYLRYASKLMQETMLPAAQHLVDAESARLDSDYRAAESFPQLSFWLGVLTLGALIWCQVLLRRRTNRVFNPGMLGATAAVLAGLGWLIVAGAVTGDGLQRSRESGAVPLRSLNHTRIDALQARAAENLDLVARGASTAYSQRWAAVTQDLLSGRASAFASNDPGVPDAAVDELRAARAEYATWDKRHRAAATAGDAGDYDAALKATIGAGADTSDASFTVLDQHFAKAAAAEQAEFRSAADGVGGWWEALTAGAAVLAALGAAGVVVGLGRRLAEYR
ncbi:hypothetical protein [Kitasatospora sp. McL0602]|uniref:hypothetical protein n=1 Tax=Kitasatospora sp. McL0602 TaxID=3439530 RepID=UPI003F8A2D85